MAKVVFGNHSSVIVARQDRDSICRFYCDVLGATITKAQDERDFVRLGENFYIVFMYGDVPDASEFVRTARSVWLEIKSDRVEEMRQMILDSGLVRKLCRTLTFTFRLREGNAGGSSESTRTSRFTRELRQAQM